ncbi:serine hydrolase [Agriterribacter sp.]|uniref:serine hydrolase n=1 Tax=Agriterribacter sp. TaxID=2821509 RepID=UPI002B6471E1|nr:serine hydrolase [Agriterribacter sp.]HRO47022.1 serine hydrolase [Agriterribacter sp.]HRQ17826.1 serine hydrolase [Agriterribacter sp.]
MKKLVSLSLLLLFSVFAFAQKNKIQPDKRLAGLDTALEKLLKDWKAAGFAVAVVEKNKVIYSRGFGYRDYAAKKPVTPNTLFAIGSCTKAFTASLLGMLEKDGKLSLDKKATGYLPALHFFNAGMDEKITVRDMMSHRTGLPRHDYSWYLFPAASRDSLLQRIQYQEPNTGIREAWQYNNFMFLTQGMIAEKISGKSWEENIKEKIFTPLGMSRSNLSTNDMEKDEDASLGYGLKKDSSIKKLSYFNIDGMGPAGSINSSVTEMANWVMTWINNGQFNGKEVLPGSYIREAISAQMAMGGGIPEKESPDIYFSNYGLAWFLSSYRGHYRVEHGGNIDGFSASTSFFPSDSIGIIVLTNQNASAIPSAARNLIADRMLKLPYRNWSSELKLAVAKATLQAKEAEKNKTSNRVPGTQPSHTLTGYEGIFNNPGYGDIEIYSKKDSLFARTNKDSMWLRHYHYDVFEVKGFDKEEGLDTSSGGTVLNFRTGDDGKIGSLGITMEPSLKPIEFVYKPKPKALSKEELQKYVGEYELGGMTTKVYLKGETLFVFVPGQPEYETIALGNDTFKLKALEGFSVRFDVANDKVTGINFIQPNGTFKAKRK